MLAMYRYEMEMLRLLVLGLMVHLEVFDLEGKLFGERLRICGGGEASNNTRLRAECAFSSWGLVLCQKFSRGFTRIKRGSAANIARSGPPTPTDIVSFR
jgi:hypothetical protein